MCELSIKNYPKARAENNHAYFDINYLLTFYTKSFNWFWCDSKNIKDCTYCDYEYDSMQEILTEKWIDKNGSEFIIKQIVKPPKHEYERIFSQKYYENVAYKLKNIEF